MSEDKPPLFFFFRLRVRIVGVGAAVTLARARVARPPTSLTGFISMGSNMTTLDQPGGWRLQTVKA